MSPCLSTCRNYSFVYLIPISFDSHVSVHRPISAVYLPQYLQAYVVFGRRKHGSIEAHTIDVDGRACLQASQAAVYASQKAILPDTYVCVCIGVIVYQMPEDV